MIFITFLELVKQDILQSEVEYLKLLKVVGNNQRCFAVCLVAIVWLMIETKHQVSIPLSVTAQHDLQAVASHYAGLSSG